MRHVIGLIGRIASGKGVVSGYMVQKYGAVTYRFSDVLRDVLTRLGKPNTRENLQALGLHLRQIFGENVLAEVLKSQIQKDKHGVIVVDGVRFADEADMIRSFPNSFLIAVTAPVEVRYRRAVSRATRGEQKISFKEFRKNEANPTERLIDEIAASAEIRLQNLGTKDALLKTLDTALKERMR
jgi:dephospho-CoA kinase